MLRDNLVELIEPMLNSAGANPLALTHHQIQASGDRLPCLENPRPKGAESSLTENVTSPFQAEPAHTPMGVFHPSPDKGVLYNINVFALNGMTNEKLDIRFNQHTGLWERRLNIFRGDRRIRTLDWNQ
jgi:hypothetical protein